MGKLLLPALILFLAIWLFGGTWWYTKNYHHSSILVDQLAELPNKGQEANHFYPIQIRHSNILFQGKKYDIQLTPQLQHYFKSLKLYLEEVPDAQLLIVGHTDNIGEEESNLSLSQKRAQKVRNALVNSGINEGQLIVDYQGSKDPVASNDTESGRKKNRRVEIRIQ